MYRRKKTSGGDWKERDALLKNVEIKAERRLASCVYARNCCVQFDPLCAMMNLDNAERFNLVIVRAMGERQRETPKCVVLPPCHLTLLHHFAAIPPSNASLDIHIEEIVQNHLLCI